MRPALAQSPPNYSDITDTPLTHPFTTHAAVRIHYIFPQIQAYSQKQRSKYAYRIACQSFRSDKDSPNVSIVKNPDGKPYFATISPTYSELLPYHLSLSHCHQLTVLALSLTPIGIDCEHMVLRPRQERLFMRLLQSSSLLPEPIESLSLGYKNLSPSDQSLLFYKLWTYFEAISKIHGWPLWYTFQQKPAFPAPSLYRLLFENSHRIDHYHVVFHQPLPSYLSCSITTAPQNRHLEYH